MASAEAIAAAICAEFEGFRAEPYLDAAGIPTIGYGTTVYPDGRRVTLKDAAISHDQALEYKRLHIAKDAEQVRAAAGSSTSVNQLAALLSFAYNCGVAALKSSTLLARHRVGDRLGAADEFPKWRNSGGRVLVGLLRRRFAEAARYLTP